MKSIAIVCLVWSFAFNAFAEETVNIATGEWTPFLSKNLEHGGPLNHIITKAFALGDVKVKYQYYPWKRAMKTARGGKKAEATAVWGYSDERAKDFEYSEPVGVQRYVFFHLKTYNFDWKSYDDLKGIRIGATLGYSYGDDFQNYEKENKIDVKRVPTDEQNVVKLLKGRIQLFPNELIVGYDYIRKTYTPEQAKLFTHHPKDVVANNVHLLFSKKSDRTPKLLEVFNKGLKQLRESGEIDQILKDSQEGKYDK